MVKILDNYELNKQIGEGKFGKVYSGINKDTNKIIACKQIRRDILKGKYYQLFQTEVKVLKTCNNQNIIELYDIKKTSNHYYLIMEFCNQGDLDSIIKKNGRFKEQQVLRFFRQILHAFETLSSFNVLHRDFKLANILIHNNNIKIADFGFSKMLTKQQFAKTMLGSPLNMAPQVLDQSIYNSQADVYSVGVCIYELLYGHPPYQAKDIKQLIGKIRRREYKFNPEVKVSNKTIQLIKRMLEPNPQERISFKQLFNQQFYQQALQEMKKLNINNEQIKQ